MASRIGGYGYGYDCDIRYDLRLRLPEWRITINPSPGEGAGSRFCETAERTESEKEGEREKERKRNWRTTGGGERGREKYDGMGGRKRMGWERELLGIYSTIQREHPSLEQAVQHAAVRPSSVVHIQIPRSPALVLVSLPNLQPNPSMPTMMKQ